LYFSSSIGCSSHNSSIYLSRSTFANIDAAAIADGGGAITVAASIIYGAQEIGFGLIDAGLGLGGILASETVRQNHMDQLGAAWEDVKDISPIIIDEIGSDLFSGEDDFRVTAESQFLGKHNKAKAVIGTDFKGLQFKNMSTVKGAKGTFETDEVLRVGTDWDGNSVNSIILEKTIEGFEPKLSKGVEKAGFGLELSFGARHNLTTNQVRTALNFKLETPAGIIGFEWRGAEHDFNAR
jgi:hypothetical protein